MCIYVLNEILSKKQHFKFDKIGGVHRRTQLQKSQETLSRFLLHVVTVRNIRLSTVQYHSVQFFWQH